MKVQTSIRLEQSALDKLKLLNEITRVPQAAYIDEAMEDLFKKYKDVLESH